MLKLFLRNTIKKGFYLSRKPYCHNSFDLTLQITPVETKPNELPPEKKISEQVLSQLEAISLVKFGGEEGIKVVEDAISYADKLEEVNTDGVEPLFTVLENESLHLREDSVKSDINTADLLSHAEKTLEGYYIVPAGNIAYNLPSEDTVNITSSNIGKEKAEKSVQ